MYNRSVKKKKKEEHLVVRGVDIARAKLKASRSTAPERFEARSVGRQSSTEPDAILCFSLT